MCSVCVYVCTPLDLRLTVTPWFTTPTNLRFHLLLGDAGPACPEWGDIVKPRAGDGWGCPGVTLIHGDLFWRHPLIKSGRCIKMAELDIRYGCKWYTPVIMVFRVRTYGFWVEERYLGIGSCVRIFMRVYALFLRRSSYKVLIVPLGLFYLNIYEYSISYFLSPKA